jgi:hypothetical protein
MSLKAFHIFFICVSILLAAGFAAWEIKGFVAGGESIQLIAGIGSIAVGIGLSIYGIRFMKKLKHVRMI